MVGVVVQPEVNPIIRVQAIVTQNEGWFFEDIMIDYGSKWQCDKRLNLIYSKNTGF